MHICKRCVNGQVIGNQCLQCGAEYDNNGNLTMPLERPQKPKLSDTEVDGDFVKDLRMQLNLTQRQLAKHLGITKVTVYCWETGRTRKIKPYHQERLKQLL